MTAADYKTFEHFGTLFLERRPRLEATLRRYQVPHQEARGLLEETVLELIYKGESVGEPGLWLESRLTHKCRRFWVQRRHRFARAMGRAFPHLPPEIGSRTTLRGDEDAQDPPG